MAEYFNKNYYPTPRHMIDKMLEGVKLSRDMVVLEPSAGMGAICEQVKYRVKQIDCIEINTHMADTLKGKGYAVIHDDFLTYSGAKNYDLIIMNPPFDKGAEHFMKAVEVLRGGHIVCLLNAETIKNAHTQRRQELAKTIEFYGGTVEYIKNAFVEADRKTGVEVALVRLYKPTVEQTLFDGKAENAEIPDFDPQNTGAALEKADYISALIRSYQNAVACTAELYKQMRLIQLYAAPFGHISGSGRDSFMQVFFEHASKGDYTAAHNSFQKALQASAWATIFERTKANKFATTGVRQKFDKWREQQGGVDLNEANINLFFEMLFGGMSAIKADCIKDAFECITKYSEKNRSHFGESWKTNSHYMVGKKFILPIMDGYMSSHSGRQKLDDIDRALCLISGKSIEDISATSKAVSNYLRDKSILVETPESEFFKFQIFAKGTGHFTFKDENLRMMFNREACKGMGWQLPESENFAGKAKRN